MLHTDLREGDSFKINGVVITLGHKTGSKVRLSIDAPKEITIMFEKSSKIGNEQIPVLAHSA